MQLSHKKFPSLSAITLGAVLAVSSLTQIQAEDKKADPTGSWTWTTPGRNGGPERKMTLKLKTEGEKLTGTLTAPSRGGQTQDTDIKDGKIKGDEVSFTVSREINGNTMTTKYHGKVSGDAIKGKVEFERNGENQSRDWEAKRAEDKK